MKRPLSCRLGWHRWYQDGALIASADRCDKCGTWRNSIEGANVERVREAAQHDPEAILSAARAMYPPLHFWEDDGSGLCARCRHSRGTPHLIGHPNAEGP